MEKPAITGRKNKKPIPTSSKLKCDGELNMTRSHNKNNAVKTKPMIDKTLFVTRLILTKPSKNVPAKNKKKNKLIKPASFVSSDPES